MPQSTPSSLLPNIDWLNIFNQCLDHPSTLPKVLEACGVTTETLNALASPGPKNNEPYGRNILFKSKQMEVMLASWSNKSISSPHNHGASKGLIWFVHGNFTEQNFSFQKNQLVPVNSAVKYSENSVVVVSSSDIHSCGPLTTGLSLHLYSPPIHNMKVWDVASERTLIVADDCGAWIPENSKLILSAAAW